MKSGSPERGRTTHTSTQAVGPKTLQRPVHPARAATWGKGMKLIYECRLCGQVFEKKSNFIHIPAQEVLGSIANGSVSIPGDPKPLAVHECGEGQTGLAELMGVRR